VQLLLFTQESCARCPEAKRALDEFLASDSSARGRVVDARRETKLARTHEVMSTPWAVLVDDGGKLVAEGRCMTSAELAALWARGRRP
jgi:thioredoxin-related protein